MRHYFYASSCSMDITGFTEVKEAPCMYVPLGELATEYTSFKYNYREAEIIIMSELVIMSKLYSCCAAWFLACMRQG